MLKLIVSYPEYGFAIMESDTGRFIVFAEDENFADLDN